MGCLLFCGAIAYFDLFFHVLGTSAFVTKDGKLIMYGKDTNYCEPNGVVGGLTDVVIRKVALGKAHCVAVDALGQLYTFGLNNKGQCGRKFQRERNGECGF